MHKQIDLWNKSRKRCQKGSIPHLEMGAFLGLTSIKNAFKNQWMSKIAPDGTKMWPNDRPNDAKVDQNATKDRCSEKVAKKSTEKAHSPTFFESHFGHIFDQKCVQKIMQNFISKKYWALWVNASKIMLKRCPKSMTNLWNFGTCDFLICEEYNVKLVFSHD